MVQAQRGAGDCSYLGVSMSRMICKSSNSILLMSRSRCLLGLAMCAHPLAVVDGRVDRIESISSDDLA